MTYSSSKKLEIVSRLIEQRIPAEMAYRMMGLRESTQIILTQEDALESEGDLISEYQRYKPKNTIINNSE
ncbi:hypothetical protein L3V82_02865 [Thiotrichales bacterium 19S3-7]|nr:hypothetical protein [Thiotrichales bacterium 19S3-7]MCF6801111.1 hypothetical protein [Thiotrichales bacterium 19S3-11]